MTATDLAHGPVAALDPLFPVWAIASDDETLSAVVEGAERVARGGRVADRERRCGECHPGRRLSAAAAGPRLALLAPLLSVVPGQLFAWALARAKGLDPDRPRGLSKVTLAR